jgi:hypothetical protein
MVEPGSTAPVVNEETQRYRAVIRECADAIVSLLGQYSVERIDHMAAPNVNPGTRLDAALSSAMKVLDGSTVHT